jgi:hypothetical protein
MAIERRVRPTDHIDEVIRVCDEAIERWSITPDQKAALLGHFTLTGELPEVFAAPEQCD